MGRKKKNIMSTNKKAKRKGSKNGSDDEIRQDEIDADVADVMSKTFINIKIDDKSKTESDK